MRRRASLFTVVLGVIAVAGAGCGGSDPDAAETSTTQPAPPLPACAKVETRAPRPEALPADFPLPPGTVITSSATPYPRQLLVGGVVPADLDTSAAFFSEQLPEKGYELGFSDAESGEAEAQFTGHGYRGKWKVNSIARCGGAVTLTLVLIQQS